MSDRNLKDDEHLKSDAYWQDKLTPEEFAVCRGGGTEHAFTGEYNDLKGSGQFACRCCGELLFSAEHKFNSGSGWPSFFAPIDDQCVQEHFDESHGMRRTEIVCRRCQCHLGHLFNDGPAPTGMRYCVNSLSIQHQTAESEEDREGSNKGDEAL